MGQQLTLRRGDDWSLPATFTLLSGTIIGAKLWMTIKSDLADPDPGLVQITTTGGGIVIDDGTHATFTLTAAQTALLPATTLCYDVQIKLPGGGVYTTQSGPLRVLPDATRDTT